MNIRCQGSILLLTFALAPSAAAQIDTGGEVGRKAAPPRPWPQLRVKALCIGINTFGSDGMPQLILPENEATQVAKTLRDVYGYDAETLLGKSATKDAIEARFGEFVRDLGPNDALIVFIATHGRTVSEGLIGRGYLVPYAAPLILAKKAPDPGSPLETEAEQWARHAVAMQWLQDMSLRMNARHVLFLIDACSSGMIGKRGDSEPREDLHALIRLRSRGAITAGTEEQTARGGVFTPSLLDALSAPGAKSVTEVFDRVRRDVATKSGKSMLPQFRQLAVENGEFVFVPKALLSDEPKLAEAIEESSRRRMEVCGTATTAKEVFDTFEAINPSYMIGGENGQRAWSDRFTRFEDRAAAGDPLAMAALYYCYSKGLGTGRDSRRAYHWARRAFETGHPAGGHVLGECYKAGEAVPTNLLTADNLQHQAAAGGFSLSRYALSLDHVDKAVANRIQLSHDVRAKVLEGLARCGDEGLTAAICSLGWLLSEGVAGMPIDRARAVELFKRGASDGHAGCMRNLAVCYRDGVPGVLEADLREYGVRLLEAGKAGHAGAQAELGANYRLGKLGFARDYVQARKWSVIAAEQGDASAMVSLFRIYWNGEGVSVDRPEAVKWLDSAAGKRYGEALLLLGCMYDEGVHYAVDEDKALALYEQAGEAGEADGWYFAAVIYQHRAGHAGFFADRAGPGFEAAVRIVRGHYAGSTKATETIREARLFGGADYCAIVEKAHRRLGLEVPTDPHADSKQASQPARATEADRDSHKRRRRSP